MIRSCKHCGIQVGFRHDTACPNDKGEAVQVYDALPPEVKQIVAEAQSFDTSKLGPVSSIARGHHHAETARVVRDALMTLASHDDTDASDAHYMAGLARGSDATLYKLSRMLKV